MIQKNVNISVNFHKVLKINILLIIHNGIECPFLSLIETCFLWYRNIFSCRNKKSFSTAAELPGCKFELKSTAYVLVFRVQVIIG